MDEEEWGASEENVYKEDIREELIENDEISAEEEGFMAGYNEQDEEEEKEDEIDKAFE